MGPGDAAVTGGFHKIVAKLDLRGPFPPPPATAPDPVPLFTHSHRVWRVAVSPEGVVASADDGGNVHLAKPDGTQRDWNEPGGVMGVAFSIEAPRRLIYTTGTLADPLIRVVDVP